ncbi:MAG: hypothetical protein ABW133_13450 [Polyangiaceae bacterium]
MSRGALSLFLFALTLGTSTLSSASAASRLAYSRTPGAARCPDERAFRRAVADRLGYDPFFPWAEQTVAVDIFEEKGALRGKLSLVDRDGIVRGTRELKGGARDCEDLLASLALATSITLDPMAVQRGGAPPAEGDTPPSAAPPNATPSNVADTESRAALATSENGRSVGAKDRDDDRASPVQALSDDRGDGARDEGTGATRAFSDARTRWSIVAGPIVAFGETPSTSFGGRLGGELHRGSWAIGAEFRGDLPTTEASESGATVHVGVLGGALTPCFAPGFWSVCGVVYLGSMSSRGSGVTIPREESLFFSAAGVRAELVIPLPAPVDLRLHADVMKSLIDSRFVLQGREVWATPPYWGAAGVSAAYTFP